MSIAEITGFAFGIGGIWLTIKKNILCFPVGLVNVIITAWLVWNQYLYADFLQQLVYFILLIYGWITWTFKITRVEKEISVTSQKTWIYLVLVFLSCSAFMGYLLKSCTNATLPYMDSTGTVMCFIAQWMIALKKIENWYLWIVANCMYIVIFYLKDMPLYSILSTVYLVMAFIGLWEWSKLMKSRKHG